MNIFSNVFLFPLQIILQPKGNFICKGFFFMKMNTTKNIMKGIGATLAVCSAVTMMASSKTGGATAKKAMKKTANKVADVVDTISSFM